MERFFTNKRIWKMLIVAILVIMAVQVIVPTTAVFATGEDNSDAAQEGDNLVWKGILMRPVTSFLVTIGDGIMTILHSQIMGQESSLLPINLGQDLGWVRIALAIIAGIIVAAAVIWAAIAFAPGIIAALSEVGIAISGTAIWGGVISTAIKGGAVAIFAVAAALLPETLYLPTYTYSAEEIFKGNILLFDVDFFNVDNTRSPIMVNYSKEETTTQTYNNTNGNSGSTSQSSTTVETGKKLVPQEDITLEEFKKKTDGVYVVNYYYYTRDNLKDEDGNLVKIRTSSQDSATELRAVISKWYVIIRNICIVLMLSVLVYIGIRMILTTVANDRAKYKEMIKDWFVGLCLLFVMHYIMAFSITLVGKLTSVIDTAVDKNLYIGKIEDKNKGIENAVKDTELQEYMKDGYLYYPTNLMGYTRIAMQKADETGEYIGYVVCFLILVMFTVMFTFTYLKRLLYMAFLTMIAPLVALTYCIDKTNDGQAQGFNTWLKEYIFNLLIQPMHLLLYFVLVTSAIKLAQTNVIYSIVALGFMIPAEKLLRRMFGFEKAKTPPLLGGPLGTSLMMQGINSLSRLARGGKSSHVSGNANSGNNSDDENSSINFAESVDEMGTIAENMSGDNPEIPRINAGRESESTGTGLNTGSTIAIAGERPRLNINTPNNQLRTANNLNELNGDNNTRLSKAEQRKMERRRLRETGKTALRAKGRSMIKNAPKNIANTVYKGTTGTLKRIPGAAIGAATGLATAGLAGSAAIASGDPKNFATAMGTATGIGYSVGSRVTNSLSGSNLDDETKEAIEAAKDTYNSEEWNELEREKHVNELLNDPITEEKARSALSNREPLPSNASRELKRQRKEDDDRAVKEFMDNYEEMIRGGVTDFDRALALHQGIGTDFKDAREAVAYSKLYDRFGQKDPEKMGAKERDDFDKTMVRGLKNAGGSSVTDDMAIGEARNTAGKLSRLHKRLN